MISYRGVAGQPYFMINFIKADKDFYHNFGYHIQIWESFRTAERQQQLYDDLTTKGMRVAPVGSSWHEKGLAVDVKNWGEAAPYLIKYNIVNGLPDDMCHFSMGEMNDTFDTRMVNIPKPVELNYIDSEALSEVRSKLLEIDEGYNISKDVLFSESSLDPMDGNFIPVNEGGIDKFLEVNGAEFVKEAGDIFRAVGLLYKIKPEVLVCVTQADSSLGRHLKTSYNLGNVGNRDDGSVVHYSSLDEGIMKIGEALNNQYMGGLTMIGQMSGGGRYVMKTKYDCANAPSPFKCYATSAPYTHDNGEYYGNWNHNTLSCLRNIYQDESINEWFEIRTN